MRGEYTDLKIYQHLRILLFSQSTPLSYSEFVHECSLLTKLEHVGFLAIETCHEEMYGCGGLHLFLLASQAVLDCRREGSSAIVSAAFVYRGSRSTDGASSDVMARLRPKRRVGKISLVLPGKMMPGVVMEMGHWAHKFEVREWCR